MNMWDRKFSGEGYLFGTEPNLFLKEWADKINPGKVLAIAEGEGRNAVYLAKQGNDVTTWDYSIVGVDKTLQLAKQQNVTVNALLNDLEYVEWENNQWDIIVKIFGHLPKTIVKRTFSGVKEALKPGGLYISEVYSTNQLNYNTGGPKDIDLLYRPEEFLEEFKEWKFIHFFYGETERYEGANHTGLCHVIQIVVQKPL